MTEPHHESTEATRLRQAAMDKAAQLVGDMPWVTQWLTVEQIEDLKKQIATCLWCFALKEAGNGD